MRVVFSRESETDLDEIVAEIAKDSPRHAVTYLHSLQNACLKLSDHPFRFPVVAQLGDDYRRFVHRRYAVFYLVADDQVRIVRIIHGARLAEFDQFL